ncbi:MAG: right-handed parallel beta-helix repeat-containing protein [Flavobacteriales bacterium]|nr:right-handed parallel beta-helix repeat-containing protein [Flavobacteriales bacterium]
MKHSNFFIHPLTFLLTALLSLPAWMGAVGQTCNLVRNPGFEDGFQANNLNLLPYATQWYNGCNNPCNGYTCNINGTGNTPDLMDVNSTNPGQNGTTSLHGAHSPYQGNRWAHFGSIESFYGRLYEAPVCGLLYRLRLRISTPENIPASSFNVLLRNGLGTGINCSPSKGISSVSGVFNPSGWVLVTDTFSLSETESAQNFNRIFFQSVDGTSGGTGVYIDSVDINPYKMIAGKDDTVCMPRPYTLGPVCGIPLDSGSYFWASVPLDSSLLGQEHAANPVVTPDSTTMYILALYDSLNPCGILADTVILYDRGCCVPLTGDVYLIDTTLSSAGTVNMNYDFSVVGSVELTGGGTFIFNAADVVISKEATITVTDNTTLEIVNASHLHACDTMWHRLFIENGSQVEVNGNSIIEDADYALYIEDGAAYTIDGAIFNRNYRHMQIVAPSGSPSLAVGTITDSRFLCQTTASIGGSPVHELLLPPRDNDTTNIAIFATGARAIKVGAIGSGNQFDNAGFGVSAYDLDEVEIRNNTMTDMRYTGISVWESGSGGADVDIVGNSVSRSRYGIHCYDNPGSEMRIDSNTVTFAGMTSPPQVMTGIGVIEITPGNSSSPNLLRIMDNEVLHAPCGIHIANLFGMTFSSTVYVGENTITHTKVPNDAQAGILMQNVSGAVIKGNNISHPSSSVNWWETGIRCDGTTNMFFCNNTHHIGNGFFFDNDNRPTTMLVQDTMHYNQTGIFLNYAIIGAQGGTEPNDNVWTTATSWSGSNPHIMSYGSGSIGTLSPFHVHGSGLQYFPTYREDDNSGIAVPNPTTTKKTWSLGCYFSPPSYKAEDENPSLTEVLEMVSDAQEVQPSSDREHSILWNGQFGLYRKLLADEELRYSDGALNSYFEEKDAGNMGRLHRAMSEFNQLRNGGMDMAAAENLELAAYITSELLPEQRLAEVLGILRMYADNLTQIDTTAQARLRVIAAMCPLDEGFGVYIARSTLLKIETPPRQYVSECEQVPSPAEYKAEQVAVEVAFRAYPNPNNGNMNVEYNLQEGERGMLSIFTIVGELLTQRQLDPSRTVLNLELGEIRSGMYLIRVDVDGQQRFVERISIMQP